ncbi:hypothetical protein ThrDRAFT_02400 [Frankia casuarinae]|jgi:uncharacterized radical SAM superfamily Fe-S cluster-containing enzyme|uniref:Radical SAM n=1 Tax=Frankia casuarinae (strain DSM 45818 / CECT 9043 / HFP020203 / CcI3) TaxID=106370 RepID=Q2J8I8_FRACC|nr:MULTISPECIES: radical SAM protein [Frankia]ABD12404.1 Radical SAM [Frankia casuarinae]ETA01511.1 hypothetical protein CcI6DRAFT_03127 [Frankia sp. CcI6]EYT92017.1 hypothetical protein ThrDRAFT_02400 [Frankia casuarinae]KDA44774.1 hypothetical protein BMG523Draft_00296 [Frankia sp. BMG5.23]KEZ36622.1 radical SAM superfamily enzyme [Frankia sp. CeD]
MTVVAEAPTFLWLEITGRCQLACGHCYADSSPLGDHGTMSAADWRAVIDAAAELGVGMVQLIGGEPTLHPGLAGLVGHALAAGLQVEIYTNLLHVTAALWKVFTLPGVRLATSYTTRPTQPAMRRSRAGRARMPGPARTSPKRSAARYRCVSA